MDSFWDCGVLIWDSRMLIFGIAECSFWECGVLIWECGVLILGSVKCSFLGLRGARLELRGARLGGESGIAQHSKA